MSYSNSFLFLDLSRKLTVQTNCILLKIAEGTALFTTIVHVLNIHTFLCVTLKLYEQASTNIGLFLSSRMLVAHRCQVKTTLKTLVLN